MLNYLTEKENPGGNRGLETNEGIYMSDQIVHEFQGELRVSSLDVSERTGVEHRAVLQLLSAHENDFAAFGQVAFEMRAGYNNSQVRVAQLNEQQATLLITYMRNSDEVRYFKRELVRQFYEMRMALAPKELTDQQIVFQALTILKTQNEQLEAKVERDAPKVDYVDTYVADGDLRLLRNVAKSLGMTESELRADLLGRKWIYVEHTTRWSETKQAKETIARYSAYAHKAQYFDPVPNHLAPRFKGEVMHTLKVTPAGAVAIARLYGKHIQAVEDVA